MVDRGGQARSGSPALSDGFSLRHSTSYMIIWRGYGFLVPLIAFACILLAEIGSEALFRDDTYYQEHAWPLAFAFILAGALVATADRRFPGADPRVMIDEQTGERVRVGGARHSFFFVPLRYWSVLLVAMGVGATLLRLVES